MPVVLELEAEDVSKSRSVQQPLNRRRGDDLEFQILQLADLHRAAAVGGDPIVRAVYLLHRILIHAAVVHQLRYLRYQGLQLPPSSACSYAAAEGGRTAIRYRDALMATEFQPPPTYADVVLVDEQTKRPRFNPIWLKWFLALTQVINNSGGGSGTIDHESLSGLQGGSASDHSHLTAAQVVALTAPVLSGRLQERQGANVAAANNLTVGTDGNYFQITGATQINLIDSSSWQGGSRIEMKFNSNPLVKHNQAASGNFKPIMLNGGVDFATAANNTLTLVYDSTDAKWYELARKV